MGTKKEAENIDVIFFLANIINYKEKSTSEKEWRLQIGFGTADFFNTCSKNIETYAADLQYALIIQ